MIIEIGKRFKHEWFGDCNQLLVDGVEIGILMHTVSDVIEVNQIWIADKYRRKGLATKIIHYLMELYPDKNVVGLAEPDRCAVGFWKSIGAELDFENADWYIPFVLKC